MVWKKQYESHPVSVGVAVFLMTVVQLLFVVVEGGGWVFNPALGVALVFIYVFGSKVYPGIFAGVLLGQVFMRIFIYQADWDVGLLSSLLTVFIVFLQIELLRKLAKHLRLNRLVQKEQLTSFFVFAVSAALVSLLAAYLHLLIVVYNIGLCEMGRCYFVIAYGDFMGLMILVPSGFFAYRHDPEMFGNLTRKKTLIRAVFIALYIAALFVLALGFNNFDYLSQAYALSLFFIVIGFLFNYRLIHYFGLLYLIIGRFFYAPAFAEGSLAITLGSMVFFTAIMAYLTLMIKRYIDLRLSLTKEIAEKTWIQDCLLTDIYQLLHVSEDILNQEEPENSVFLRKTFEIGHQLFRNIDAAYAYVEDHGAIKLIDTWQYQEERIPYIYEAHQLLEERHEDFSVIDYLPKTIKTLYGEKYGLFEDETESVGSRLMMRWMISPRLRFVIVVDRFEGRPLFSKVQRKRIFQFRNLMDSLYKRNYYTRHQRNLKEEIILGLVRTLELYDAYTKGHSEDVAFFALAIADRLALDDETKRRIYWAGILHDIGKVGIDGTVLNKPGALTAEEYQKVKEHAEYGYEIIKDSTHLAEIAKMVKHHHEWWDGKGYPDKLKGEAIPLGSRIIALADMVSTMATNRPYRKRQTSAQIIAELKRCRGNQFPPNLTDVMVTLIEEGIIEKRYQ